MSTHTQPELPPLDETVAGALFDLMGWLTSHPKRWVFSSRDYAGPAVEALEQWAKEKGYTLADADVTGWRAALASEQAQPSLTDEQIELAWRLGYKTCRDAESIAEDEDWGYKAPNVIEAVAALSTQAAQPEIIDSPETGYPSRIIDGKHVPCSHDGRLAERAEQPVQARGVPELNSSAINGACWAFIDAMPHELPGPIWNDLKPAVYAAVAHVFAAAPSPQQAEPLSEYTCATPEKHAAVDAALELVALPVIRVSKATHGLLERFAALDGKVIQAVVREVLEVAMTAQGEPSNFLESYEAAAGTEAGPKIGIKGVK